VSGANGTGGTPLNRSIGRAATLLGLFTPDRAELSLAELTEGLGTTKASAHRYALALRHAGFLRYDASRQIYMLGPRVVELAATALVGLRIMEIAGAPMERLRERVNETVVLSVWDGQAPVVVRVDDNTDRIARIVVRTGTRLPPDSAQGKVFAAFGPGPPHTLPRREAAEVRSSGVAVNSRVQQGIRAIATPVFQEAEPVAAMALVGTTASIPADPRSRVAGALRHAAEELSGELGFVRAPVVGAARGRRA
jgi:IclR family pca regulon transcriptional regulator